MLIVTLTASVARKPTNSVLPTWREGGREGGREE
jgi:hypothetical protein